EGRHRVGEHHFADDAVLQLLGVAHVVVPVAVAPLITEIAEWVLVLVAPGVEVLAVGGVEVLAVHGVAAAGMTVGGDDRVVVIGVQRGRAHRLLLLSPTDWRAARTCGSRRGESPAASAPW